VICCSGVADMECVMHAGAPVSSADFLLFLMSEQSIQFTYNL